MEKPITKYKLRKATMLGQTQYRAGVIKTQEEWLEITSYNLEYWKKNWKKNFIKIDPEKPPVDADAVKKVPKKKKIAKQIDKEQWRLMKKGFLFMFEFVELVSLMQSGIDEYKQGNLNLAAEYKLKEKLLYRKILKGRDLKNLKEGISKF